MPPNERDILCRRHNHDEQVLTPARLHARSGARPSISSDFVMSLPDPDTRSAGSRWLIRMNRRVAIAAIVAAALGVIATKLLVSDEGLRRVVYILPAWSALTAASFWAAAQAHKEVVVVRWFMQRFAVAMFLMLPALWAIGTSPRWLSGILVLIALNLLFVGTAPLRRIWRELIKR